MTHDVQDWPSFVESLPSQNAYNHEFLVSNWVMTTLATIIRQSGLFKLLDAFQGLAIVIAVVVFFVELGHLREERIALTEERSARKLSAVTIAYAILEAVEVSADKTPGFIPHSRRQMIALEELHKFADADDGKYLAGLIAPSVPFNLIQSREGSGCESKHDPKRVVLNGAYLDRAILNASSFVRADLMGAHLYAAQMNRSDLTRTCLVGANLEFAELRDAVILGAELVKANLSHATLAGAALAGSNLTGANLTSANLSGAVLAGTIVANANFYGVNLSRVRTEGGFVL